MTNQLIPVFTGEVNNQPVQLVDARLLHEFLQVGRRFASWITDRISEYDFVENNDFIFAPQNGATKTGSGGHNKKDYHLTLDMAKELSMVERNEKGKQARRYFIECEKQVLNQSSEFAIPTTLSEALLLAGNLAAEKEKAEAQIEADKPKVEFAMAVRNLDGSCLVREFAKIIGTGQNRLFKTLRDRGYLMVNNEPYQRYVDSGVFVVVEGVPFTDRNGKSHPTKTTRITGKGQIFLEKKLRNQERNGLVVLDEGSQKIESYSLQKNQ